MQHRVFVAVAYEQVLSRREPAILFEPPAADEKRLGAGPAAQAGGFEIEEHERQVRRRAAADERRLVDRRLEPGRQFTHRRPAATRRWWCVPFDDEGAVTPFAAEDRFCGARTCSVRLPPDAASTIGCTTNRPAEAGRYMSDGGGFDDLPQAVSKRAHAVFASVPSSSSRPRILSAAAFARRPVSPMGPTQPGQPFSQSPSAIRR